MLVGSTLKVRFQIRSYSSDGNGYVVPNDGIGACRQLGDWVQYFSKFNHRRNPEWQNSAVLVRHPRAGPLLQCLVYGTCVDGLPDANGQVPQPRTTCSGKALGRGKTLPGGYCSVTSNILASSVPKRLFCTNYSHTQARGPGERRVWAAAPDLKNCDTPW